MKKSKQELLLESTPDKKSGNHIKWTQEQDALILKFCESKGFEAVSRVLGIGSVAIKKRLETLRASK